MDAKSLKIGAVAIVAYPGGWSRVKVERAAEIELDGATTRVITNQGTLRWHADGSVTIAWRSSAGKLSFDTVRSIDIVRGATR